MTIKAIFAVLLSLTFGALCFGAGAFTTSLNQNMCYSEVLSELGSGSQKAANASNQKFLKIGRISLTTCHYGVMNLTAKKF